MTGASADLGIHSDTLGAIARQFVDSRYAAKHCPAWRSRKKGSLGWMPFNAPRAFKIDGGAVIVLGRKYRLWLSRPVPQRREYQDCVLCRCLVRNAKCEAVLIDLDGDGQDEILLFDLPAGPGSAFQSDGEGSWSMIGTLANEGCPGVRDALHAGKFEAVTPAMKEVKAAGQRVTVTSGCKPATR